MKKSLSLAMALALGVTTSAYAANPFSDVPQGHWAYASVAQLAADGVIDGYADGSFAGDKLLTRYEMAQIVAKAMANGADCDKLAAEFADELDTLGVRVAKLESKADAVKITGEVRYHYADKDVEKVNVDHPNPAFNDRVAGRKTNENQLRSRIWIEGQVNDDWKYTGMLQNTQDLDNETGDEETKFKRAYVEGKIGGVDVLAGRYNAYLVNGNLYDEHADGIELSYGKDVKFTAFAMKPTDQSGCFIENTGKDGDMRVEMLYDKAYGAKIDTNIGVVKATAGYTVFKDGKIDFTMGNVNDVKDIEDNKVWNVGVSFDLAKNLIFTADYLKSDLDSIKTAESTNCFDGDDGIIIGLNYKGAKSSEPGSYGLYANYYDQARGTVIAHTMNGALNGKGFSGYMVGANYTIAKNIVASLEWYNLNGKTVDVITKDANGGNVISNNPEQDMETLWAQVVFTF